MKHITIIACLLVLLASPAMSEVVSKVHVREVSNILWAEMTDDIEGWSAALNTYNADRRKGESLLSAMKRKSSAYRTKSNQYVKASTGNMTADELRQFHNMQAVVSRFNPDTSWRRVFHENMDVCEGVNKHGRPRCFYKSKEEAFRHLRKVWGNNVDLEGGVKIGVQTYFEVKGEKHG